VLAAQASGEEVLASIRLGVGVAYHGDGQVFTSYLRSDYGVKNEGRWWEIVSPMESGTDQLKKRDLPYISDAAWSRTPCTTLHSTILLQPFAVPKART